MLIPIGHTGAIRKLPIITISLIVLNSLIFMLTNETINKTQMNVAKVGNALAQHEIQMMMNHDNARYKQNESDFAKMNIKDVSQDLREFREEIKKGLIVSKETPEYQRWLKLYERYMDTLDQAFLQKYGFVPVRFNILGLITCMYLHGGWFHLIFNMLFLWVVGGAMEDRWGVPVFLLFYHVGGIISTITHYMGDMQTMVPLLGASGAISAVMGAFLIRHYKTRIKFVYFLGFAGKFQIPALLFLPFWLAEQFFFATTDTIGSGVAFWAHIGGFIYGMIFALLMKMFQVERLYINPQQERVEEGDVWKKDETPVKETLGSNVSIAKELMAKEKYGDAIISLNAALSAYPSNLDTLKLLYFAYLKTGQVKRAIEIAGNMCERLIHDDRKEDAAEVYGEIKKVEPTAIFPLRIQYNLARALSDLSMFSDSARAYYEFAVGYPDNALASKTLFMAAQIILIKLQSPQNAYKILVYLNHKYPNHPNLEAANEMISRITGAATT